jgi:hypothetical protein
MVYYKKKIVIVITFFLTILLTSCQLNLTALYTTEEVNVVLEEFTSQDITHESELPIFEQTVVRYTINQIPVESLDLYERPLFDQYQSLRATVYGSDQTVTYLYQIYVLSDYSPKHNYKIELNNIDLETMTRETFQQGLINVYQEDEFILPIDQNINVRHRGNSSWANHEKKPFRLEFDSNVEMMGLRPHDTFYLISIHADKSLMRDVLAHQLANMLNIETTQETRYVDLYINDAYHGLYLLIEDRRYIQIDETNEALAFALELDFRAEWEQYDDETWFYSNGVPYVVKRPSLSTESDADGIQSYLEALVSALENDVLDEENIDIQNWASYFFIQEYFKNVDAWGLSTFLYKEANEPVKFGPVWDFDLSVGNADYVNEAYNSPEGYWFITHPMAIWPQLTLKFDTFSQVFENTIRNFYVNTYQTWLMMIDTLGVSLIPYAEKNFQRWDILNEYIWPNPQILLTNTYYEQVTFVKNFLEDRMLWLLEETYQ